MSPVQYEQRMQLQYKSDRAEMHITQAIPFAEFNRNDPKLP